MILRGAIAVWALLLAGGAVAQVVTGAARVASGEHDGFTRVVIEYPGPVDWQVGRTPDGYELRLPDGAVDYDLSRVFDLIGRERLASVSTDKDGALRLSIACGCFVMPFEFRPGTLVMDIRNGPPPKGSSFEEPLPATATETVAEATPSPQDGAEAKPAYDWTATLADGPQIGLASPTFGITLPGEMRVDLEPLRQSLIEQLSRGATQGIVQMAHPQAAEHEEAGHEEAGYDGAEGEAAGQPEGGGEGTAAVEVRLGEAPNLVVRQKGEAPAPLSAEGAACIPDERLNIAEWAADTPISGQMADAMTDLTGEFDKPDPEAVKRAVRFYLSLGFGAEARAILRAFPTEQEDAPLWESMAHILDDETDPDPAFAGMAACDTSAALWAILADPEVMNLGLVEKAAVLRAFSALPVRLRQQVGPTLVDRFLAMKDFTTATSLRDAVVRGLAEAGPEVELMEAAIEKASGSPAASEARLEELTADPGPTSAEALAALIIQRAENGQSVSFEQVQAIEEYAKERSASEDFAKFNLALMLAYAASGDFRRAFDMGPDLPEGMPVVWHLLGVSGKDSDVLQHTVLLEDEAPQTSARSSATLIAQRLITLGLADQAARWLAMEPDPPRLLAARIAMGRGEAAEALRLLEGEEGKPADELRIEAHLALGDEAAVADIYTARDMPDAAWNAVSRMRDWDRLAAEGPQVWRDAASALLEGQDPADPAAAEVGPLAQDRQLVEQSVATRAALEALLGTVTGPQTPSQ